jgi:hypothetical protein
MRRIGPWIGLFLAVIAGASLSAQPNVGASPDTLTVRHIGGPPAPDPLPAPIWIAAPAVLDGKLYIFGGIDQRAKQTRAFSFDPATGHWTRLTSSPSESLTYTAAAWGNRIIVGNLFPPSAETSLYDPKTDSWSAGPGFVHARGTINLLSTPSGPVALGGFSRYDNGSTVGVPDVELLKDGVWRENGRVPALSDEIQSAAAVLDGKVYFGGGFHAQRGNDARIGAFHEYDPVSRRWRDLAPLPTPRAGAAGAALGGKIYFMGGENRIGGASLSVVEVYDPKTDSWSEAPPLPCPRRNASAAVLEGRLYLVGGSPQGEQSSTSVQVYDPTARSWSATSCGYSPAEVAQTAPVPFPDVVRSNSSPATRFNRKSPERPDDYALVIGVGGYSRLPAAQFAEEDARDAAAAFESLGVPEENIVTLSGSRASLAEMTKYVEEWLPRRVTTDSRVYFYFSGHGAPDVKDGSAYLMPWDADAAYVKSTGFPLARLYAALGALPAKQVIALIDSCFSGAGGRSVLVAGTRPLVSVHLPSSVPPRISIITASESEEIAGSLPARGHGLFTWYALQGLSGAADVSGARHLTLQQLYAYVRKHVILDARRENREQTPTLISPTPKLRLY